MKKFALRAVAVVVGLIVLNLALRSVSPTLDLGSHLCTALSKISRHAKDQVPLDWEIDRVRDEVSKIDNDISRARGPLARQLYEVEELKKDIGDHRARLDQEKKTLLTMKADVESGNQYIVYGDTRYPASRIKEKLTKDFDAFKTSEKALDTKEKLLQSKEEGVAAAREQLDAMRGVKEQLTVELSQMDTELKLIRLQETKSKFHVDDSRLARIKDSIKDMHRRIDIAKKELALQAEFADTGAINVDQKVKTNEVLKDIDNYFSPKAEDKVVDKK